jgi:predicted SpoU family rRNA methylase
MLRNETMHVDKINELKISTFKEEDILQFCYNLTGMQAVVAYEILFGTEEHKTISEKITDIMKVFRGEIIPINFMTWLRLIEYLKKCGLNF